MHLQIQRRFRSMLRVQLAMEGSHQEQLERQWKMGRVLDERLRAPQQPKQGLTPVPLQLLQLLLLLLLLQLRLPSECECLQMPGCFQHLLLQHLLHYRCHYLEQRMHAQTASAQMG